MRIAVIPAITTLDNKSGVSELMREQGARRGDFAIVPAWTIEEVLLAVTGKNYTREYPPLQVPEEYETRMRDVAEGICARTQLLEAEVRGRRLNATDPNNHTQALQALDESHLYSRASLCFSRNIDLSDTIVQDMNALERATLVRQLRAQAAQLREDADDVELRTISDLETYAIVRERIVEAQDVLREEPNDREIAYAQERLVSAQSWAAFYGLPGRSLPEDRSYLRRACITMLAEAEERLTYVRLLVPQLTDGADSTYEKALEYSATEPALCIFTAAQAKAEANVLAEAITVGEDQLDALIERKLEADNRLLRRQQAQGFFPILGYSYTQYASDLRERLPYNALIFTQSALEVSTLDMYFPSAEMQSYRVDERLIILGLGVLLGLGLGMLAMIFMVRSVQRTKERTREERRVKRLMRKR
jgi:predicted S18 family serine protease